MTWDQAPVLLARLYCMIINRKTSECFSSADATPFTWRIFDTTVSTIVFWVRDQDYLKEYLYGVARDKITYVRSDDNGVTWKSVAKSEFDQVKIKFKM